MFRASCDIHDFNYALGGAEEDRKKADDQFLAAMLEDAAAGPWYLRWWYRWTARAYYKAVREFGSPFFTYRRPGLPAPTLKRLLREARGRAGSDD